MNAVLNGHREMAELLLEGGANADLSDHKGETAADYAARGGHPELSPDRIRLGAGGETEETMAKDKVEALTAALKDANPKTRLAAATALGELGAIAVTAIPALQKATQDKNRKVRLRAEWAIAELG